MILITGASGLLGACILGRGMESGREVVGIARNRTRLQGVDIRVVDLTDPNATRGFVAGLRPSVVIHCAAATDVDWCEDHPREAEALNTAGARHLAHLAREVGARFVQISTDSVFDGLAGDYSETDQPKPLNVYARTKCAGEEAVLQVHPQALVLRVNFYGSGGRLRKQKLAEWILGQLKLGLPVRGFTNVFFCPLFVGDLAQTVFEMLDHELTGLYHVVGSEKVSKYEFAVRLATTFGFESGLVVPSCSTHARLRAARPLNTSLRTEKLRRALGHGMPDLNSGLQRFKRACDELQVEERTELFVGGQE